MDAPKPVAAGVFTVQSRIRLGPGFYLPLASTLLVLPSGGLAVVSPLAFDPPTAAAIEALGPVEALVAPNRLHHLYLGSASRRWPLARVLAAPGLAAKRPDLRLDAVLGEPGADLGAGIELLPVDGVPALSEVALLHRASGTVVVTDLVFNVTQPEGWLTPWVLRAVGAHRRLAQSRAVRAMTKDRAALAASVHRLLARDFTRLLVAHGDVVESDAQRRLAQALSWVLGEPGLAPSPSV